MPDAGLEKNGLHEWREEIRSFCTDIRGELDRLRREIGQRSVTETESETCIEQETTTSLVSPLNPLETKGTAESIVETSSSESSTEQRLQSIRRRLEESLTVAEECESERP